MQGGVTSSSLEVLAALALDDVEFSKYMAVTDEHNPPTFYQVRSPVGARVLAQ